MTRNQGDTAPMCVGMVLVTCPACGGNLEADVMVQSVSTRGGAYLNVAFQDQAVEHRCAGRRT